MEVFMDQFEEESINDVEDILLSLYISYFSSLYYLELIITLQSYIRRYLAIKKYDFKKHKYHFKNIHQDIRLWSVTPPIETIPLLKNGGFDYQMSKQSFLKYLNTIK